MRRLDRWELLAIGSFALAALARFHGLEWDSLCADDLQTLRQSARPTLREVVYDLQPYGSIPQGNPPLYQVILHPWCKAFGTSDAAARLPAAIFGVACVVLLYAAGRALVSKQVGAIAALALAVMPFHVFYSQQVRSYSLFSLAGLGAFYFLVLAFRTDRLTHWAAFAVMAALQVHVHYFGLGMLGCQFLVVLVRAALVGAGSEKALWTSVWKPLAAVGLTALLLLPIAYHLGVWLDLVRGEASPRPERTWGATQTSLRDLVHPIVGVFFANSPLADRYPMVAAFPALVLLALFGYGLVHSRGGELFWPLLACTVLPIVGLWTAGRFIMCWEHRFFAVITPMVALTMAAGIAALRKSAYQWGAVALLLVICVPTIVHMQFVGHHWRDHRSAAKYIAEHSTSRPLIILWRRADGVRRYLPSQFEADFIWVHPSSWDPARNAVDPSVLVDISRAARGHEEVWYVSPNRDDACPPLEEWVNSQPWIRAKLCEQGFFNIRATCFRTNP